MSWTFGSVAVVGSGAIGLYYGGKLAASGEDVRFLLRSDYDAVKKDGIRCESVHGNFELREVQGFLSAEEIGPVDLVIVSLKATANDCLPAVLPPLLHSGTQVLTLQNGLGNCEAIARIVGENRVMGALCFVCLNRLAPGFVKHTAGGRITVGEFAPGLSGRSEEIVRRMKAANILAEVGEPLAEVQWKKLVWNIPFNGLAIAEGGVTTEELLNSSEVEAEIRALMKEVVNTGRALGLNLGDDLIDINIERTRPMGPYRPSSMIDYVEGNEVEVGPIWEEPLRRGKEAGASMPRLERLLERIHQRLAERP